MKVCRRSLSLVFFVVTLGLVGAGSCGAQPFANIIADSVKGFSGTQGGNGWWYGYWDQTADDDRVYSQQDDLRLLDHFGADRINGLSGHSDFTTGELWYLEDGSYYTSLWAEGGHPHGSMDLGTYARAEQWAVRRWVSTVNGSIEIHGHAGKVMPWGKNWSGSVKFLVVAGGARVYEAEAVDGGKEYSVTATVEVGTPVDFLIGPGSAIGVMRFTATLRATGDPSN
jgi:hypothetical protein